MPPPTPDVTVLLHQWRGGDAQALERLLPIVYDTLRSMASQRLAQAAPTVSFQPTSLVHDALLRLLGGDVAWSDRVHFMALAALKMRAVLVDHARRRGAAKRGAGGLHVTLSQADAQGEADAPEADVLALHQALESLAGSDERAARVVELAYFGGLEREEIAEAVGVSVPTVDRDLRFAKAWLNRALT